MKRNWVHHLIPGIFILAACGSETKLDEGNLNPGNGDGGPSGRIVVDSSAGASDGGEAVDAVDAPVTPLPEGVSVKLKFLNVTADQVVKSTDSTFKPAVVVDVASATAASLPRIRAVYIDVEVPGSTEPPIRVNLEEISSPVVDPDAGLSAAYTFGNILVSLAALQSGVVELHAFAETADNNTETAKISIKVDAGPVITFIKPTADESFKGSARIEVRVSDAVFTPIKDVTMLLGSTALVVESPEPGLYTSTINFATFIPPLSGEQLVTVRGSNSNGTQSVAARKFVADNVGPTFEMLKPSQGQLIGGVIEVSAVVKDPAGVEPTSVVAVIGNGANVSFEVRLNPPPIGSNEPKYSRLFDAKLLPENAIFPTVSFRAADKLGNESSTGFLVSLDNMPPLADLDPPSDFRLNVDFNNRFRCTWPFDPVGPDAVDDGQLVNQAFDVRVRAEDQGNSVVSGNIDFVPISGVKKVELLVLDDTSKALIVDTDADGKCDAMNPLLTPTSRPTGANDILLLGLEPLTPQGVPDNFPEFPMPACDTGGLTELVKPLCDGLGPTYNPWKAHHNVFGGGYSAHGHFMSVFPHYAQSKLPSVWTPGPIVAGVECAGRQIEAIGSNIKDGWACLAAFAEDNLGQKQVSRPLRICIDHDGVGNECPHRRVLSASSGTPIQVQTQGNHGLVTGDVVFIQGVLCQTHANGKHTVTVVNPTTFNLNGVAGRTDYAGVVPACTFASENGLVVAEKEMPDCTGVQTQKEPMPLVNDADTCAPWRLFKNNELRRH